jgi:zinc/manganese transport system substrate-binding protein
MPPLARLSLAIVTSITTATLALTGCSSSSTGTTAAADGRKVIRIVAAENFWGSMASQIGGTRVAVTNIIDSPDADPHDYEPTPADGRSIASADVVIVNGVGYDAWADKLLSASPGKRTVIDIGQLVGAKAGDNPHRWYNPANVQTFIKTLTADLSKLDPSNSSTFAAGLTHFQDQDLKTYHDLVADIRRKYSGTPVGASESIFAMISPALGLDLITPPSFLSAISEGTDVTAADKSTIDRQIATKQIKIYVYNSQNATPDIQAQLKECQVKGIPTATITETLTPATASYQQWQTSQLRGIETALAKAAGE